MSPMCDPFVHQRWSLVICAATLPLVCCMTCDMSLMGGARCISWLINRTASRPPQHVPGSSGVAGRPTAWHCACPLETMVKHGRYIPIIPLQIHICQIQPKWDVVQLLCWGNQATIGACVRASQQEHSGCLCSQGQLQYAACQTIERSLRGVILASICHLRPLEEHELPGHPPVIQLS